MTAPVAYDSAPSRPIAIVAADAPEAMARLGARLATRLRAGDAVALGGGLGSGKTTFARGLIRALAGLDTAVPSPTFTLVQIYETPAFEIWHCDLYRLTGPRDTAELGLEEAFSSSVVVIEWPDRLGPRLPANCLRVTFAFGPAEDSRIVTFEGSGVWPARLVGIARDA